MSDLNTGGKEDLFGAIGMADLSDEEKGQLFLQMIGVIQTRAIARIIEEASEEEREKIQEIIDADQPSDVLEAFLDEKCPNYPSIFEDEASKLREELIIKFTK
jgi:Mg/Co/Ni transporter MgtE